MTRVLLSAHKAGYEEAFIANSLAAAEAVRDNGVDLIEFDVRVTKDCQFVTLHDDCVQVGDREVPVEELSASDVLKHAPGACQLADMLYVIKDHAVAHVDLKDTHYEVEIADMCVSIVGTNGFILTTLEDESVLKIRLARPQVQVALSLGRDVRQLGRLTAMKIRLSEIFPGRRVYECDPTMLALNYKLARLGVLWWAYRKRIPVLLWTMNDPRLIAKAWRNKRIWAFTTNNPRQALAIFYAQHRPKPSPSPQIAD